MKKQNQVNNLSLGMERRYYEESRRQIRIHYIEQKELLNYDTSLLSNKIKNMNDHDLPSKSEKYSTTDFRHSAFWAEIKTETAFYHIYFELSDVGQMDLVFDSLENEGIEVDVLVNNAGINTMKPLLYTDYNEMEESFRVNYYAPVMITKRICSIMMRQGHGAVVNVTSMGSLGHQPGGSIYDASKAALNQFTITAAQELAPLGIRVNAVACGPINTDMFASMPEKVQSKLIKYTALKRAANLDEIIDAIIFLSSENSSYITGQILRVDGGAIL